MVEHARANIRERLPISAFIICQNEASKIAGCLDSLHFCSDIVVVDSGSTDLTLNIVGRYRDSGFPIRVFHRPWHGYAAQKQFALDQCLEPWCLNLDADERLDEILANEIARIVTSPTSHVGFRLPLRAWLGSYGYAHRLAAKEYFLRLVRREAASYDLAKKIHEGLRIDGSIGKITRGAILHLQKATPEVQIEKQNRYTSLKAEQRAEASLPAQPWRMLTSPIGYFLKYYVLKRYFLCGWAGVATSMVSASYGFQTELKHWILCNSNADRDHSDP